MLNRRVMVIVIVLGGALLAACKTPPPTPTELEAVQASTDAYLAYERGDCDTVRRLTDPDRLDVWSYSEGRNSMLLLQGFCLEIDGDHDRARDIYRQLILEAPDSFASQDAVERTRILKIMEQDPGYARRVETARERIDPEKTKRTPVDRVPAEFPPLAKATGVEGYAIVEFNITRRGDIEDPIVVDSSPPLLFDGAALRAVRRWQYMPKSGSSEDDQQLIRLLFRQDGSQDPSEEAPADASATQ
jgi:TonB family protein